MSKSITKQEIAILVGGHSTEYDASLMSYENTVEQCNNDSSPILIKKVIFIKNNYVYLHHKIIPQHSNKLGVNTTRYHISELPKILSSLKIYIFSLLHGNEGEDGSMQGLADIYRLNGSFGDVLPSALSMNKWQMAEIAEVVTKHEVKKIPYFIIKKNWEKEEIHKFINKIKSRYFVIKPNRLGASLFAYKVGSNIVIDQLQKLAHVFDYDTELLLQKYIPGKEFTFGLVQRKNKLINLSIVEAITKNNFLGHSEKHKKGLVSARFDEAEPKLQKRIIDNSQIIFKGIGLTNFCRFDYIFYKNSLYFLEANSIPGLMKSSIFPKMLEAKGLNIPTMLAYFIENSKNKDKVSKRYRYKIEE
jgi:D-alanine-D-alanine ligase